MIKKQSKQCEYHFKSQSIICTQQDCGFQTRLVCIDCLKPNKKFYHKHQTTENCIWPLNLLYYRIDEFITLTHYCHFSNKNLEFENSFKKLNHYLSCLKDCKLSNIIQQNYKNLLQSIGTRLEHLDLNEHQIKQFQKQKQIQQNKYYDVLKMCRKYQMKLALISDDNNFFVMGWHQYLYIESLKDLNYQKYIQFETLFISSIAPNSKNLLVGCQNGLIKRYNFYRQILQSKSLIIRQFGKIQVRNIVFLSNNIILINIFQIIKNKMCQILKVQISNNKQIYKFVKQGDFYLHFDHKKQMIILNNKEDIYIFQEHDRKEIIEFNLPTNQQMSQIQQIDDNTLISLSTSGRLLFFRINYLQNQLEQFKQIHLNAYLIYFNKITQEIIAQTEQSLIIINSHNLSQVNIPFLMDYKNIKYNAERQIGPMQNSKDLLVTLSRNTVVLFKKK